MGTEIAIAYGASEASIISVRPATDAERAALAEWAREGAYYATGGAPEPLPEIGFADLPGKAHGHIPGANVWIVDAATVEALRALNAQRAAERAKLDAADVAAGQRYERRVAPHICPRCETFCGGDCRDNRGN